MSKLKEKGITLIALVVTIIILLILAGVTLNLALSDTGIFNRASATVEKTAHEMLKENLQIKQADYILEAEQEGLTETFIEHLEKTKIISKESEGVYVINAEKLLGGKASLGNGSNGKDVYKLEKKEDIASVGKIASTEIIKIAEESSTNDKYDIVYYDKSGNGKTIGTLTDIMMNQLEMITFYLEGSDGDSKSINESFTVKKGTTWKELAKENSKFFADSAYGVIYDYHNYYGNTHEGWQISGEWLSNVIESKTYNCKWYHQVTECVFPDSNITVSNDQTVKAKDIREGQDIAYYNFEKEEVEIGTVSKVYIHKKATSFVRYTFEDGSYLEATDYHPIYTKEGWKSYTRRNGYEVPKVGDEVKTETGYKKLINIESYTGEEDCYDFAIVTKEGKKVDNYFANGTLVESSL